MLAFHSTTSLLFLVTESSLVGSFFFYVLGSNDVILTPPQDVKPLRETTYVGVAYVGGCELETTASLHAYHVGRV